MLSPMIAIPLFFFAIILWIYCCHVGRKLRVEEQWPQTPTDSPTVYVIPIYEEEQNEEAMGIYEAYFQPTYSDLPVYSSGEVSPPPPYRLEPPPYPDPPPSYSDILHLPPPPQQTPC